jgi:hypothetical protein
MIRHQAARIVLTQSFADGAQARFEIVIDATIAIACSGHGGP